MKDSLAIIGLLCFSLFILSCNRTREEISKCPEIKQGSSKIEGRITSVNPHGGDIEVLVTVLHPITGENVQYKASVDSTGKFSVVVDLEIDVSYVAISSNIVRYKSLFFTIEKDKEVNVDIVYDTDYNMKNSASNSKTSQYDMINSLDVIDRMIDHRSGEPEIGLYEKTPDYFLKYTQKVVETRLTLLDDDPSLSMELKNIATKELRLFLYNAHVFDYESEMKLWYVNGDDYDLNKERKVHKVDQSYYRFLRTFKLNDPSYLYCFTFPEFQKTILQNKIIGIPRIGEMTIDEWLKKVKAILSDLVGFDNGLYYDILAANEYGRQLNEEQSPFTENQIRNIEHHWKGGEISKILLKKNNATIELNKLRHPTVVNNSLFISTEAVLDSIISKHKGKAIVLDLWATWCSPCLSAIRQFRETKNEFVEKDVVFVYLTNTSSSQAQWREAIKGIGGEHYYLSDDQWKYIMGKYKLEAIPSYIIYDRKGKANDVLRGYPGDFKMKDLIEKALST